ncbi:unnamed protein product [Moneuplotes crassus]|uniref:Uncharacterized protein n=1 Tax=Euplotes crassus TaxID=5936 RepID=A0AAD1UE53_EUPCR|nr:unnamed protein product [Moneuplotes crassus]
MIFPSKVRIILGKWHTNGLFIICPRPLSTGSKIAKTQARRKKFFRYKPGGSKLRSMNNSPTQEKNCLEEISTKKRYLRSQRKTSVENHHLLSMKKARKAMKKKILGKRLKAVLGENSDIQQEPLALKGVTPHNSAKNKLGSEASMASITPICPKVHVIEKLN